MKLTTMQRGMFLLPTIAICNRKHYYGYFVLGVNIAWLKWQLIFNIGAKKVNYE